ncbi:hypothetical protein B296_00045193 [Ensete ventricosum]|uniref:Serine-tRNA synthetase type1 N-terminal domain-containing protein n=1 Tax=Ensete ventricosum TaxID=4639 RepID=A0A426XF12_ENSVE|nr:hypothetical protein B296_00045193 [Ensete ventricosum]
MLDINIFRAEKGFDPERIRESQRRRFASVDEIIHLDREWRQRNVLGSFSFLFCQCELDGRRRDANRLTKEVKNLKIVSSAAQIAFLAIVLYATEVISITEEAKRLIAAKELEVLQAKATLDSKLETIGNLIHDSIPLYEKLSSYHLMLDFFWQNDDQAKQYVHMLNSTLTATERTICCILENYQRENGVQIPQVLQPFMGGLEFLPFKPVTEASTKTAKAKNQDQLSKPFIAAFIGQENAGPKAVK